MQADVRVGPAVAGDGSLIPARAGKTGEMSVSDAHARYYETNYRNAVYSDGLNLTSIANATFTTGTLGATVTPIAGLWNPSGSGVNCVILQATLGLTVTAGTATGPGPFMWAASVGNTAVSTGNNPFNRKSLSVGGSQVKGLCNVAPTGLTNNLVVRFASSLNGGLIKNISSVETAVGQNIGAAATGLELFDGSLIVPPGGVIALLSTTQAVAHSAVSGIVWEEVAV